MTAGPLFDSPLHLAHEFQEIKINIYFFIIILNLATTKSPLRSVIVLCLYPLNGDSFSTWVPFSAHPCVLHCMRPPSL